MVSILSMVAVASSRFATPPYLGVESSSRPFGRLRRCASRSLDKDSTPRSKHVSTKENPSSIFESPNTSRRCNA